LITLNIKAKSIDATNITEIKGRKHKLEDVQWVSFNTNDCVGGVKYLDNEESENKVMSIAYISRRG
jgi:hypothetical protein